MVYILLATGFEEIEAIAPCDLLRRAGIPAAFVGVSGKTVAGSHGIPVTADLTLGELDLTALDMIVLPGGLEGVKNLAASREAMDAVRFAYDNGKWVAAICAAPSLLAELGITDGRAAVCYPAGPIEAKMSKAKLQALPTVQDGRVITGTSAGCAVPFGLKLVEALKGPEAAAAVKDEIVIR